MSAAYQPGINCAIKSDNDAMSSAMEEEDSCGGDETDIQPSWIDQFTDISDILFNCACVHWKLGQYQQMCEYFRKCLFIENEIEAFSTGKPTLLVAGTQTPRILFNHSRLLRDILNDPDFAGIEMRKDILECMCVMDGGCNSW